jgi:hypothetical protein
MHRRKLRIRDSEAFGLGLALWENAGLLGVLTLFSLLSIQLALSAGGQSAQELYASLLRNRPDLFYPSTQALPLVAWGTLERTSSLLFHFSWGYLTLRAACLHRRQYLFLAMPMGLVDFLVPFARLLTIPVFESILIALALGCLALALTVGRGSRGKSQRPN